MGTSYWSDVRGKVFWLVNTKMFFIATNSLQALHNHFKNITITLFSQPCLHQQHQNTQWLKKWKEFFASFRSSKLSNKANLINEDNKLLDHRNNECPRKIDPVYIVSCYIKARILRKEFMSINAVQKKDNTVLNVQEILTQFI